MKCLTSEKKIFVTPIIIISLLPLSQSTGNFLRIFMNFQENSQIINRNTSEFVGRIDRIPRKL